MAGTAAKIGGEGKVLEEGEGPVGRVDNLEPPRDDPLSIEIQKMVESKEGGLSTGRTCQLGALTPANKLSKEVAMVFIVPRPCHVSRNHGQLVHVATPNRSFSIISLKRSIVGLTEWSMYIYKIISRLCLNPGRGVISFN